MQSNVLDLQSLPRLGETILVKLNLMFVLFQDEIFISLPPRDAVGAERCQYPWIGIQNNKDGKAVSRPTVRVHIWALR